MVYAITVREVLERTVCVEANDVHDAIDKVHAAYKRCDIVLDADDFDGQTEFVPSCYAGNNGIVDDQELDNYREHYQWIEEE